MKLIVTAIIGMLFSAQVFGFDQDHKDWDNVLKDHVADGLVDYKAVSKDLRFSRYLGALADVQAAELKTWTRDQQMAYWINAYNAYTMKAILDHYPIRRTTFKGRLYPDNSIRQIEGVWDELRFQAGGQKVTLNEIEHGILRKDFADPRIHVALVCASIGCPHLQRYAFVADTLDEQLTAASKAFVENPLQVRLDLGEGVLYLSKILDWYGEDFPAATSTKSYGGASGPVAWVAKHLHPIKAQAITGTTLDVKWISYDWTLNEKK